MKPLLSLGTLIDTSVEHYRTHFPGILGITLWFLVGAIPSGIGILLSQDGIDLSAVTIFSFIFRVLGGIFATLVSVHISVALILALREQHTKGPIDPRVFLKKAFSKDLSYIWAKVLQTIATAILPLIPLVVMGALFFLLMSMGDVSSMNNALLTALGFVGFLFIFLALAGLVKFSLAFGFTPYTLLFEDKRGLSALRASAQLVKGRWWPAFWRFSLPKIIYTMVFVAIFGITFWITGMIGVALTQESFMIAKLFAMINFFLTALINAFMIPIMILNDYYLYENLRETRA